MSTYQFAAGYDNAGSLVKVSIQPNSPGVFAGIRRTAGNGLVYEDGFLNSVWNFGFLRASGRQVYSDLLTELGLDSAVSVECTIKMPNNVRVFTNYNAVLIRPDVGRAIDWTLGALINVQFELIRMSAL
jgi:hypothetical protein